MNESREGVNSVQAIDSDKGFSLIELLVYSLLLSLVIAMVGGMIISALTVSDTVVSMTRTSTAGQLVARSVVTGIRNSSDFRLTSPVDDDQLLVARTASFDDTVDWRCLAWYYSPTGEGAVWFTSSSTAIAPPTTADLSSWTLLTKGVQPASGTGIFSALNERLSLSILGLDGLTLPIDIRSSATSRAGASGSLACF
ncbi:hypothetical protein GCM10022239_05200 [Leifsonia bigeumensis]|uniref:Prepilin-type N-terminal cleavage/methylation domain-containing protein n=1 Tax=Leifsonella bigeumensis TaxID=433643 RepID=A0ABP7F577_9MICO